MGYTKIGANKTKNGNRKEKEKMRIPGKMTFTN